MNKKYLTVIFLILLAVFAALNLFSDKKEKTFNDIIAEIDTADINIIKIIPGKEKYKPFVIKRNNDGWILTLEDKGKSYKADSRRISDLLVNFEKIKISNIVTKNPDKRDKYEVGDKNSKEIVLYSGDTKLLDLIIGKIKFNPQTRAASTYIRLKGDNTVYSTDKFNGFIIPEDYNSYLNMTVSRFDKEKLNTIDINNGNRHLTLKKYNGKWDYEKSDSVKLETYISSLSNIYGSKTIDFDNTQKEAAGTVNLRFNGEKDITITAYPLDEGGFAVHSSYNPGIYFKSDSAGLYRRVFEEPFKIPKQAE